MLASYRFAVVILIAVATTACLKPHAPEQENVLRLVPQPEIAGDVPVTVENDLVGFDKSAYICDVRASATGVRGAVAPNMLPSGMFTGGGVAVDIKLRAGTYLIEATTCTGEKTAHEVVIAHPTAIHFDYRSGKTETLAGIEQIHLAFKMPDSVAHPAPPAACIPNGEWSTDGSRTCCDAERRTHYSRSAGRLVCGP